MQSLLFKLDHFPSKSLKSNLELSLNSPQLLYHLPELERRYWRDRAIFYCREGKEESITTDLTSSREIEIFNYVGICLNLYL